METLKKYLKQRREHLLKHIKIAREEIKSYKHKATDMSDVEYEDELIGHIIENEEREIKDIDEAFERIDNGSYGICETCNKKIPHVRLKAVPSARLCIKCKEMEEGDTDSKDAHPDESEEVEAPKDTPEETPDEEQHEASDPE